MPGFACGLSMCVLGIPVAGLQIPGTPRPGLLDWGGYQRQSPLPTSGDRARTGAGDRWSRLLGDFGDRPGGVRSEVERRPDTGVSSHRRRSASKSKCKPSLPWVDDRRCGRGSEQPVSHARGNRRLEPLYSWPSGHGEKRQIRQITILSPSLTAERTPHLVHSLPERVHEMSMGRFSTSIR